MEYVIIVSMLAGIGFSAKKLWLRPTVPAKKGNYVPYVDKRIPLSDMEWQRFNGGALRDNVQAVTIVTELMRMYINGEVMIGKRNYAPSRRAQILS